MALSHDIAARSLDRRDRAGGDATAGIAVVALLLALVLGFSAVDVQSRKALDAGTGATVAQEEQATLDGRGKWGGYLK